MKRIEKYFNVDKNSDVSFLLNDVATHIGIHENGKFIWCQYNDGECDHCIFSKYEDCEEEVYNYLDEEIEE